MCISMCICLNTFAGEADCCVRNGDDEDQVEPSIIRRVLAIEEKLYLLFAAVNFLIVTLVFFSML